MRFGQKSEPYPDNVDHWSAFMTIKPLSRSVCLLGGTGFVGRHLAGHLIRAGYHVRVPTRRPPRHRNLLVFPGLELVAADIQNEQVLRHLLTDCDAVINLVGILNERGHSGHGFQRIHVELTEKIVSACQDVGVPRLIHLSALRANADKAHSHYLRTKGEGERLITQQCGEALDYTIFRPSTIFGPDDSFTVRFARLLKRLPLLPLPCPDARMMPVFVHDVARAITLALRERNSRNQRYDLCGPDTYTLLGVVRLVREVLGRQRAILPLPHALAAVQAWVGEYFVPGKPFSLDNLRTLAVPSISTENGFAPFGITPSSLASQLPRYLHPHPTGYLTPHSYEVQTEET